MTKGGPSSADSDRPQLRPRVLRRSFESLPKNVQALLAGRRTERGAVKAAYLILLDGTLVAKVGTTTSPLDDDLFSATLDVIQNFMRTSFPFLKGTFLRTIEHGNLRILIERGRYSYLTLLIEGLEESGFRNRMRQELQEFETKNAGILEQMMRRIRQPTREAESPSAPAPKPLGTAELLAAFIPRGRIYPRWESAAVVR